MMHINSTLWGPDVGSRPSIGIDGLFTYYGRLCFIAVCPYQTNQLPTVTDTNKAGYTPLLPQPATVAEAPLA